MADIITSTVNSVYTIVSSVVGGVTIQNVDDYIYTTSDNFIYTTSDNYIYVTEEN